MTSLRLPALAAAFLLAAMGGEASGSEATAFHLRLVRSQPAADSSVASPAAIRLWFSEQPQLKLSAISVTGPGNAAVKLGDARTEGPDPLLLMADVPAPLAAGQYKVQWRTASRDGHPIKGEYTFRVAP